MASKPLIVICGTTGVGKSKLGIELALTLASSYHAHPYRGARIINADSMQVYAGMDVITNKVPVEERCGIEHLLMDYKKPGEQLTGPEWIKDAIEAIDETHGRNKLPIVVGGTSYWIQHLIFPERMASLDTLDNESLTTQESSPSDAFTSAIASTPAQLLALFNDLPEQAPSADLQPELVSSLHNLLTSLDPLVAQRWHWRDSRKVLTNLRVIRDHCRLASEIIAEQSQTMPNPRYHTLCFWLYAKPNVLNPRLDERVDQMIAQGLLNEIRTLREIATTGREPVAIGPCGEKPVEEQPRMDYTLGVYQAIGYKEFHEYLCAPEPSELAFRGAAEQMKLATRRYAKRQVSWIRNKLLPAVNTTKKSGQAYPGVFAYLLDATDLDDAWKLNVYDRAHCITEAFLEGGALPDPLILSETAAELLKISDRPTDPIAVLNANKRIVCPVCTVDSERPVLIDGLQWEIHVRSRGHRRMNSKDKRVLRSRSSRESVETDGDVDT